MAFDLGLSDEQSGLQKWVHGVATDVLRPAAAEWDEREELPWPVVKEAAQIGLYGWEALNQFFAAPTGLLMCLVAEELFWGDAGAAMVIFGTNLALGGL